MARRTKKEDLRVRGLIIVTDLRTNETFELLSSDKYPLCTDNVNYIHNGVKYPINEYSFKLKSNESEETKMEENKVVENEINEETTEVSISAVIPETIEDTVNLVFNQNEIDKIIDSKEKTYELVKFENKEMNVCADSRDLFVNAYNQSIKLGENVEWAQRQVIARTMDNSMFRHSFVNEGDYAEQIGVSKSYLSKAKTAVKIFEWLKKNGYGENWKATAVEELIGQWNDLHKKKIEFDQFMKFSEIKEGMTVSEIRKGIKRYKEAMTPKVVTAPVNTTSIPAQAVSPVNTTSIPAQAVSPVNTTSIPAQTIAPLENDKDHIESLKNIDIEKDEITEMNISLTINGCMFDLWLNKEDDSKKINAIKQLIKARLKSDIEALIKG